MSLPKRPVQHQLEDQSRRAFQFVLPRRVVYRPIEPDYGIDGEIEVFDEETDEPTGLRFLVQLKSTDDESRSSAPIKHQTATYYGLQPFPVLMVLYKATSGRLFARWFHEYDPYHEHYGDTHLVFNWSDADEITEADIPKLLDEADRIARLRSPTLKLPLKLSLDILSPTIHGHARSEIELTIESALEDCSTLLVRTEDEDDHDLIVEISEDEISANLSGVASVNVHSEDDVYIGSQTPDQITKDALSAVAISLAKAGHGDAAARLALLYFPDSLLSAMPPMASILFPAMHHAGRIIEILEIADRLDEDQEEARQLVSNMVIGSLWNGISTLQPHEIQKLEQTLGARLARRLKADKIPEAAGTAQTLAELVARMHERYEEAISFFNQAIDLEPERATSDLLSRLAGAYFLNKQHSMAEIEYRRALQLSADPDPHLHARHADALMLAGRYRQALDAFGEIETDDPSTSAWVYVKLRALSWVIEASGIESQTRNESKAVELAGTAYTEEVSHDKNCTPLETFQHDAISALGWFNHARDLLNQGRDDDAMHAYLVAAVVQEGDVEAWVNVAILAMNLGDANLFGTSLITGHRLNRQTYLQEFARQLRAQNLPPEQRDEALTAVRHILKDDA